jgi:hypothetical protein
MAIRSHVNDRHQEAPSRLLKTVFGSLLERCKDAPHIYQTRKRLINGVKQKPRFLLCDLTNCAGSAMGPQSDAAGASHKDVASQKAMEGLFQQPARPVCIIAVPQVHLAQLESRGRRKKSTVASSLDAL